MSYEQEQKARARLERKEDRRAAIATTLVFLVALGWVLDAIMILVYVFGSEGLRGRAGGMGIALAIISALLTVAMVLCQ
uniref:Uncharacterized protein n=1 Tax=viral metagenome TaxID=1070528 RepID=A0A6M3M9H5_9ZZZZ